MVGYEKKGRNSKRKDPKKIFLLAAEGKNKTEQTYFRNFRGEDLEIRYAPGNETDPEQMMRQLIRAYQKAGLKEQDYAVCLVDADFAASKDSQLKAADKLAWDFEKEYGSRNLKLIVSAPCFEIWFLCHFDYSTRQYITAKEVVAALSKYIVGYKKSDNVYESLKGKERAAAENAKKLEAYCKSLGKIPHTVDFAPSSEVYRIFEEFIDKR